MSTNVLVRKWLTWALHPMKKEMKFVGEYLFAVWFICSLNVCVYNICTYTYISCSCWIYEQRLRVSHAGDVWDIDAAGGSAQSEGCESIMPTTSFADTTPGDSCHIAMATSATYLMQCLFILLVQLWSGWLDLIVWLICWQGFGWAPAKSSRLPSQSDPFQTPIIALLRRPNTCDYTGDLREPM